MLDFGGKCFGVEKKLFMDRFKEILPGGTVRGAFPQGPFCVLKSRFCSQHALFGCGEGSRSFPP